MKILAFTILSALDYLKNFHHTKTAMLNSIRMTFSTSGIHFPKIHLYQHQIAGKENIHQFYKEQFGSESVSNEESGFTKYEEDLFADIQNALEENDITDLRANLMQLAQSLPAHQYSAEEIEDYIYNQMDAELKAQFEEELVINPVLASEVRLIKEIDIAGAESDIISLRASLNEIQKSEFQATASIEELESYINSEFSDEELASFEAELTSNQKLQEEIDLVKNIDLALNETDVMQLRSNLQRIAGEIASTKQTERSFAGRFKAKRIVLSTVAASLILLLGITGIMSRQSQNDIYQNFYTKYEATGIVRSADVADNKILTEALQKYNDQDYNAAVDLFNEIIARDENNMVGHFYAGASLQETGKYPDAIKEYETVIIDKDNLFTEQAQWFIGLCYLQTNENKKAYQQFKKIAKNEGYYQQKAQAILNKIKVSE